MVWVDYEPISAVIDLKHALQEDIAFVHEDLNSTIAAHVTQEEGNN